MGTRNDEDTHERSDRFGYDPSAFGERTTQKAQPQLRVVNTEEPPEDDGPVVGVARYKGLDPNFDEAQFLDGAQRAYEMILMAFAAGDKDQLQPLLSDQVYQGFVAEIEAREARGETLRTEITRMAKPVIDELVCDQGIARITVRFVAHIKTTVAEDDTVQPERTEDLWTFERPVADSNPNWRLTATQTV